MNKPEIILYKGDCIEKMKLIKDNSIDLVLCDLPYGSTKCKWDTIISMDILFPKMMNFLGNILIPIG